MPLKAKGSMITCSNKKSIFQHEEYIVSSQGNEDETICLGSILK